MPLDDLAANGNIADLVPDLGQMEADAGAAVSALLTALRIPIDHNTEETAARVARMFVREVFAGRYAPMPALTRFPNVRNVDQIYAVGPIAFRSCCAHHLVPILGRVWIGVLPGEWLIGLSKFHRLTQWIMSRPQIQEEATDQLAAALDEVISPPGLGVIVKAKHLCTAWRGVRDEPSELTTSVMRGAFFTNPAARAELMTLIGGMGYA